MQNIKDKLKSIAQTNNGDSSIGKKIEMMSANFKSMPTIIARDLRVEGEINGNGVLEVEGHIKGIVKSPSVIVREEGVVEGEIYGESINIKGEFNGTIKARHINVSSKAKITGTIEYESLTVEDGASIDGKFIQSSKQTSPKK